MNYTVLSRGEGDVLERGFPMTTNAYVRAWVKVSSGFQYASNATKLSYSPRYVEQTTPSCLIYTESGVGGRIYLLCQGAPNPSDPNLGGIRYLSPSHAKLSTEWNCVEWQVDYGTPGSANGAMRLWWNDQLVIDGSNLLMVTSQAGHSYAVTQYLERGLGQIWWDDFAVGNTRQGCGGTVPVQPQAPAAPTSLVATSKSVSQVNLSWKDNSNNERAFEIERKVSATGTWGKIAEAGANVSTYSATGLSAGRTYWFRVRAVSADGLTSSYSNEVTATTTTAINGHVFTSKFMTGAQDRVGVEAEPNRIFFRLPIQGAYSLSVFDPSGRQVWRNSGNSDFGIAEWKHGGVIREGVYIALVKHGSKTVSSQFCIVK